MPDYKILFGGDLHKLHKDISTIRGYQECHNAVQRKLMQDIETYYITHFVSLGDWYHKGYSSDISSSLADVDMDQEMAKLLKGNFYGVIGNHVLLRMDSNPELHLIQPHPTLKSRRPITRTEQIMRTPDYIMLNDVQISFVHWKRDVEDVILYHPFRKPEAKYHIALFHTPLIIPNSQLVKTNHAYNTSTNSRIAQALKGVDYAVVGDIHNPLGTFVINTEYGDVTMCVPGSLTNTDAGLGSRHTSINLPMITIHEDGTVKIEYLPFDLLTNMLTFNDVNAVAKERLKSTQGGTIKSLYGDDSSFMSIRDDGLLTFTDFMTQQNYTAADKKMIRSVMDNPAGLDELLRIHREG